MMRGSGARHGMKRGSHAAHGMMDKAHAKRAMMEAHIAYKKAALNITAEQTSQWDAYAAILRKRKLAKMTMRKTGSLAQVPTFSGNALVGIRNPQAKSEDSY